MQHDELLTVIEAAKVLKVSRATAFRMIASGQLPSFPFPNVRVRRIRLSDVLAFMATPQGAIIG